MKTKKEEVQILNRFKPLSSNEIQKINELFTPYIFFTRHKDKYKTTDYVCSCCGAKWQYSYCQRITNPAYDAIIDLTHNDECECPHCKSITTLKSNGKGKKGLNEYQKVVLLKPNKTGNIVYASCYVAEKIYMAGWLNPCKVHVIREESRYYLKKGEALLFRNNNYYGWLQSKRLGEPFNETWFMGNPPKPYIILGLDECLKKSFLKYSAIDKWVNTTNYDAYKIKPMKYIAEYSAHPQIEMLNKLGFKEIVNDVIYKNRFSKKILNWQATNIKDFFGLSKQELTEFSALSKKSVRILQLYKKLKQSKQKITLTQVSDLDYSIGWRLDDIIKICVCNNLSILKLIRYIEDKYLITKDNRLYNLSLYRCYIDYISAAESLGYDLTLERVLLPRDLKKAHDQAIASVEIQKNQAENEKIQKRTKNLIKKYSFEFKGLKIKVPESVEDIVLEGKSLNHCVGQYAARHAKGETDILFLRKITDIETPFYTIEIKDGVIRQCYGYKNRLPTPEVEEFKKAWLLFLSKPAKNKQYTITSVLL